MRLSSWFAVAAVIVAGGLAGWVTRSDRSHATTTMPAPGTASTPAAHDDAPATARPGAREFLGVILTGQDVDVAPKVEGRVLSVSVKPGDHVRKGQIVAEMDVRTARQSLHLAEVALADAQQRLERRTGMVAGVLSQEEIANARALVLERRGRVAELRAAVTDASVRAPFDGAVATRLLEPGAIAGPSRPILRLVGASGDVRVRFAIPEELAGTVGVGTQASLVVKSLPRPLPIVVENVAPEVDSAARMIFAVARLESGAHTPAPTGLAAGMVARVITNGDASERGVLR